MALWQRDREGHPIGDRQLTHHDDAGSQYTSMKFTEYLALEGIAQSISSVGDAYDNALAETIIGLYKTEVIEQLEPWYSMTHVEIETLGWVDWFNNRRLLEPIGNIPPVEFEEVYYQKQRSAAEPAGLT
jgi:transposase InsO family protein